jgi:hypothetical protein
MRRFCHVFALSVPSNFNTRVAVALRHRKSPSDRREKLRGVPQIEECLECSVRSLAITTIGFEQKRRRRKDWDQNQNYS